MGKEPRDPIAEFNGLEFYENAAHAIANGRHLHILEERLIPKLYLWGKALEDVYVGNSIKGKVPEGSIETLDFPEVFGFKMYLDALNSISKLERRTIKIEGEKEPEAELHPNSSIIAAIAHLNDAVKFTSHVGVLNNGGTLIGIDTSTLSRGHYKHLSFAMPLPYIIISARPR